MIDKNNDYEIESNETRIKLYSDYENDNISFMKFKTDVAEYQIISDLPFILDNEGNIPEKFVAFDKPKEYEGIVAIPFEINCELFLFFLQSMMY